MMQQSKNEGEFAIVPNTSTSDAGVYVVGRYDLKKITFLGGGRFDQRSLALSSFITPAHDTLFSKNDLTYRAPSYALGTVWKVSNDFFLRLNGAGGFTPPNAYQLADNGRKEGGYLYEKGDSSLKASVNRQLDLGVSYDRPSIGFTASVYNNTVSNFIYLNPTGTSIVSGSETLSYYKYLQGNAILNGAEFGFDLHPKSIAWVDLAVNYGMVRGTLSGDKGNLPLQPADKITAALTFQKAQMQNLYNPFVRIAVSNYAAQNRVAESETTTSGYTLFDIHLGGAIKISNQLIDITLSGTNLLNQSYYNHLSVLKPIHIHEMGRNICLRIRVPFGIVNPDKPMKKEVQEQK